MNGNRTEMKMNQKPGVNSVLRRRRQTSCSKNNVWHTWNNKQGIQKVKLDHFLNVWNKRIRRMVDGVNVHTESRAGHNIHTVRSKYPAKRGGKKHFIPISNFWKKRGTKTLNHPNSFHRQKISYPNMMIPISVQIKGHDSLFDLNNFICLDFLAQTIHQVTWVVQHYCVHLLQR